MALTLKQIREQVLDITKSAVYTDAPRVTDIVNAVYIDAVNQLLTPIKSTSAVALTNAVADYTLSSAPFSLTDFVSMRDVIYNQSGTGPNNTLRQLPPHEIYKLRNQSYTGILFAFAIEGVDKLMLSPSPTSGDTLTLVYNYRPAAMVADADTPTLLLEEDHDVLVAGAAWRVCRWKNPQLGSELEVEYQALLGRAQARQNRKGGAGDMKMQRAGYRRPPHDNSTDRGW